MNSYKDLIVWRKAMDLVVEVYKITEGFPKTEIYGIISQMRRCSVSIPSNIAEGRRRSSEKDFKNFLIIAYSSGAELETQIEISKRLSFIDFDSFNIVLIRLIQFY
uniref:Four helix bundle protein n=1 Tax=candidate division CPR3 bacterium TaxID=2268181 RepID=A0A7C4R546_UNCC3